MRPASQAEKARLNDTFAALCRIPSPFGHERACADSVAAELRGMGLEVEEDGAAVSAGAECGNLLARIDPRPPAAGARRAERSILLCAHLDTVEQTAPIEPVLVDEGWENANDGILGADNKAAVAVLLELARRVSVEGSPVGIELLFTVSEENALAGAKQLDAGRLRSEFGYVFDHATPIGEVVVASPTYFRLSADFHGRAAHAGIRPEAGRSAVLAAALAVAAMPLGRIDGETTANVGSIAGGVGSTNVVPERCRLLGEARSLDAGRVETIVARMVDAVHDGAATAECDVDVVCERLFTGYRQRLSSPAIAAAEAALRACGYEPRRIATGGGSDANALEAAGFHCVNLANGTERNHEPTERVSLAALEGMLDVAVALLDEAAALPE
jgi:tripeptide aminopeptidase